MWIVRLALRRPYTFVVMALAIILLFPVVLLRTPVDIFPDINIPVISLVWTYNGLQPQEMEQRITSNVERGLQTLVNDVEHIESQSFNGIAVIKVFFQPGANIQTSLAQTTAISQTFLRFLPPGTTPPLVIIYSASTVPVIQIGLTSDTLSEQQLFDYGNYFIRTQLATVPGAATPFPYGGKQRVISVDINPTALQAKGLSAVDIVNAVNAQNLILPTGTAKLGTLEYNVEMNGSPQTVQELNDLPVKTVNGATIYMKDVAHVRDGFSPQTNIVLSNGQRGVLMSIYKTGTASTIDIVDRVKQMLEYILRPVALRARFHPGCYPRSNHRRLPHGGDDSALPRKLEKHADHCRLHSFVHSRQHPVSQRPRPDHQYHDPGRARARCRHPRR